MILEPFENCWLNRSRSWLCWAQAAEVASEYSQLRQIGSSPAGVLVTAGTSGPLAGLYFPLVAICAQARIASMGCSARMRRAGPVAKQEPTLPWSKGLSMLASTAGLGLPAFGLGPFGRATGL